MSLIKYGQTDYGDSGPSPKQIEYIEILRNDCGFSLMQFKDYLHGRYAVRNTDELTRKQASLVIDDLKCRKDQTKLPLESEND